MNSDWKIVKLGDVCTIRRGSSPRPIVDYMAPKGMPWVKISDATESKSRYISKTKEFIKPEGISRSVIVNKGDLILSNSGTAGLPKFMEITACIHDGWQVFTELVDIDKEFLYYVLLNIRSRLLHNAYDSTMKNLTLDMVRDAQVRLPQIKEQKRIAGVLSSIDGMIECNQNVNQTLEQMAQALFKSWFVDFEPLKAKIAVLEAGGSQEDATLAAMTAISGKDADSLAIFEREYPEKYTELRATAELFPPTMQESELGDIPAGWTSQRMSNIATLHYGKALKKTERIDGPYPVYGSGGITGSHNAYLVEGPGIIVGRKGSIGTIYWEDGKFHPIDTVYYVATKEEIPLSYLYYLMKTLNLPSMNTDAAVPGLNRDNVYRLEVLKPTQSILNKFDNHIATIRNNIQKNNTTIVSLVGLRDTLLPKLLSGEISLPEAEEVAKETDYV
ncbi:type I restriction-modification system, specificity subunit S [Hafnia paralvei ATCC 29927]|uniref:restriction endonuclease subunit S n=1 Tax=Hafnia paralvei TaxID=546367 RepID=UPI0007E39EB9|nr:restriction endonuclease subunit S [Hafnia paralvei]OAT44310.1 type I restriction-modification system, specificity subunit S [Hafnia paralvei ATCC 29927]HCU15244.1 restriction endonuclease subunit S [Hafnia paralvei]